MARFGFVGPSYQSQSINADDQVCQNWYPETLETGEGKSRIVLYPTPGSILFSTITGSTTIRGIFNWGIGPPLGRCIVATDTGLFECFSNGTFFQYTVPGFTNDFLPVSFAASPTELMFVTNGLLYDLRGSAAPGLYTITQIAPGTFTGPVKQVAYVDGFFVVWVLNSSQVYASAPGDGTTWPALSTTKITVFPDQLISMISDHRELWLFGAKQIAVYYNAGLFPFPFDLVSGGYIEQSTIATYSPARVDNSVFWLGGDERGNAIAWRANGYTPTRISNHAVETAWRSYAIVTDAIGYAYQDEGHTFYVLRFPNANHTWVYDVSTGMWHERAWLNADGSLAAHHSTNHAFVFTKHLVGDWASGNIYQLDLNTFTDNGNPIPRLRRAPHISTEMEWIFHHQLMVDMETNQGQVTLPAVSTLFTMLDTSNKVWNLTINFLGILQVAPGVPPPPGQPMYLNDPGNTTTWQLTVSTLGQLQTVSVPFVPTGSLNPLFLNMNSSPNAPTNGFKVTVTNFGMLQVTPASTFPTIRQPQLNLRWSNDGGHTWSNYYPRNTGDPVTQFATRVIWRRLGRARVRTYEVSTQDPTFFRLIDAYLLASPSFTPTERLVKQYGKSA